MSPFSIVSNKIRECRPQTIVFCLALVYLFKAGVWYIPNISSFNLLANNPFANPFFGEAQYAFDNWLGSFIAWSIGATTPWRFLLLHLAFSITFVLTATFGICRYISTDGRNKSIIVFGCLTVFWVPFYWIGYDSLTLALMAAALVVIEWPIAAFAIGIFLGLQHYQQGIVSFALLALSTVDYSISDKGPRRVFLGAVGVASGSIAGHLILKMIEYYNRVELGSERSQWFANHLHEIFYSNIVLFPTFLYGTLGFGWIVIGFYLERGSHRLRVILSIVACLSVTLLCGDTTRVFAIISFPALYVLLISDEHWLRQTSYTQIAYLVGAWLATPWLFRWGALYQTTVVSYDCQVLLNAVFGWPGIPAERATWPFH